jgi:hypothetical protein
MSEEQPFTLKMANGKEKSFNSGNEMYEWFVQESNLVKKGQKSDKVPDKVLEKIFGPV